MSAPVETAPETATPETVTPPTVPAVPTVQDFLQAAIGASVPQMIADAIDHHTNNSLLPQVEQMIAAAAPAEIHTLFHAVPAAEQPLARNVVLGVGVALVLLAALISIINPAVSQTNAQAIGAFGIGLVLLAAKL